MTTMSTALSLATPVPSLATIDSYIQSVGRFPLLSQEEETDLARRYRNDEDLEAARMLVLSHLRLVVAIARGYMGYGLQQADLIQEGNIGLMKAVKRFDPERGVRLVSFAVHWIRAEIHEFILRNWRIVNPNVKNAVGEPVAYKFLPGDNSVPYATKNAWWRKRAGFVDHHVWVTPFKAEEKHAAGDYPNQSHGGDGLPRWTSENRPIVNTDVVLWYTFGHTHLPRPEDYPVMPAAYIGFLLKPQGFFDLNPANDVPPSAKKEAKSCCCG